MPFKITYKQVTGVSVKKQNKKQNKTHEVFKICFISCSSVEQI